MIGSDSGIFYDFYRGIIIFAHIRHDNAYSNLTRVVYKRDPATYNMRCIKNIREIIKYVRV